MIGAEDMGQKATNYHYADREFAVGDTFEMVEGYRQTINAIWLDRTYGDCFHIANEGERHGHDSTPNDFYRRIVRKVSA